MSSFRAPLQTPHYDDEGLSDLQQKKFRRNRGVEDPRGQIEGASGKIKLSLARLEMSVVETPELGWHRFGLVSSGAAPTCNARWRGPYGWPSRPRADLATYLSLREIVRAYHKFRDVDLANAGHFSQQPDCLWRNRLILQEIHGRLVYAFQQRHRGLQVSHGQIESGCDALGPHPVLHGFHDHFVFGDRI